MVRTGTGLSTSLWNSVTHERLVVAPRVGLVGLDLGLRDVQAQPLEGAGHAAGAGLRPEPVTMTSFTRSGTSERLPGAQLRGDVEMTRVPGVLRQHVEADPLQGRPDRRRTARPGCDRVHRVRGQDAVVRRPTARSRSARSSAVTSSATTHRAAGPVSSLSSESHGSSVFQSPHGSSTCSARKPHTNHRCSMCSTWLNSSIGVQPLGTMLVRCCSGVIASTAAARSPRTQSRYAAQRAAPDAPVFGGSPGLRETRWSSVMGTTLASPGRCCFIKVCRRSGTSHGVHAVGSSNSPTYLDEAGAGVDENLSPRPGSPRRPSARPPSCSAARAAARPASWGSRAGS